MEKKQSHKNRNRAKKRKKQSQPLDLQVQRVNSEYPEINAAYESPVEFIKPTIVYDRPAPVRENKHVENVYTTNERLKTRK